MIFQMTQIWIRSFGISAFILCSSERSVLPACALWPIDRRRSCELSELVGGPSHHIGPLLEHVCGQ